MRIIKRKYNLIDVESDRSTRTESESQTYLSLIRSCLLTMISMDIAYEEIRNAVKKRKEIDRKLIIRKVNKLIDKTFKPGFNVELQDNLHVGNIKSLYSPMVQGGDNYNLNYKALDKSEFDIVRLAFRINYKNVYSTSVRTFLINPTKQIKNNYSFLAYIQRVIAFHLRDGVELCKVYEAVISAAEKKNRYLTKHLKKDFGYALGPVSQHDLVINSNTKAIAKSGMTFSMDVLLIGLEEAGRFYDLCSSDTVLVRKADEPAEILTLTG